MKSYNDCPLKRDIQSCMWITEPPITGGSVYKVTGLKEFNRDIWLCPVTLFVLGKYPKYLYVNKINNEIH